MPLGQVKKLSSRQWFVRGPCDLCGVVSVMEGCLHVLAVPGGSRAGVLGTDLCMVARAFIYLFFSCRHFGRLSLLVVREVPIGSLSHVLVLGIERRPSNAKHMLFH